MATDDHLGWEARQRPRAGAIAIASGLLTLIGGFYNGYALRDEPEAPLVDSLDRLTQPGPIGSLKSLRAGQMQYLDDHAFETLLSAVLLALGTLGAGLALADLARATLARRPELPGALFRSLPLLGGTLYALGLVAAAIANRANVHEFVTGSQTVDAARDALEPSTIVIVLQIAGVLGLAAAFVLVGINAMRVGLLTRFMGTLGAFTGALAVLPLLAVGPILQPLWMIALGCLILGLWPKGAPPAWASGKAEPWPSAADMRMRAQAERSGGPAPRSRKPAEPEAETPRTSAPSPATSKKRKRKRRG